jgi:hypothetical protein
MAMFRKAERKKAKAKIAVVGASGSGKTMTSILIARGLVGAEGKIAMIDTEQGSGELYSHLTEYDVARINAPYIPTKLIDSIHEAEEAGYDVLIIDSLSPFWSGAGGLLEMKTSVEQRGKNSWAAWADITPIYNRMMETIITSNIHIVATMRTKTEWLVDPSKGDGKSKVTKVGTAPVQRDGAEYEFTIVFMLDQAHSAVASKDRTGIFDISVFRPGKDTGQKIRDWLESGAEILPDPQSAEPPREMTRADMINEERKNVPKEPESRIIEKTADPEDW